MKRARASDRVICALRDRMLRAGWVECVEIHGRLRVASSRYGPAHPRIRVRVRATNGRPRPGEIGLVAALADATGYSRFIVHRALAGQPRAGVRCWKPLVEVEPPPAAASSASGDSGTSSLTRGLAAVGLVDITPGQASAPRPAAQAVRDTILQSLGESLDAALSAELIPPADRTTAERLLDHVRAATETTAADRASQKM